MENTEEVSTMQKFNENHTELGNTLDSFDLDAVEADWKIISAFHISCDDRRTFSCVLEAI